MTASAQGGPGLLPGLLNDPATRQSFDTTLATLNQVASDLQAFTAGLESSDALLPKLVKDEEYGARSPTRSGRSSSASTRCRSA